MTDRREYWRVYRRAHPQAPRDRTAYFARRHAANSATINAARRERYAARPRRGIRAWRAEREKLVNASIQADREGMLHFAGTIPELVKLIAAQVRDARTFNIRRPALFIPAVEAERLFYAGVGRNGFDEG